MRKGLEASHKWVVEHGDQYRGLWVVVDNGKLLGAGARLDKLSEQLGSFAGAIVTRIPKGEDIDWEYVAIYWSTSCACEDKAFVATCAEMREDGWEDYVRASSQGNLGGACIMRRPKGEPHRHEDSTVSEEADPRFGLSMSAARSKDEPRMWAEGEVGERVCALSERIVTLEAAIKEVIAILSRLAFGEIPKEETNG